MRCLVRALSAPGALVALLLAVSCPVLAIPAAPASASEIQHRSPGKNAADTHAIAISITGMTPQIATPSDTVTVSGTLANHTGSAMSGITVQAQTSTALFSGRVGDDRLRPRRQLPVPHAARGHAGGDGER